jgi:4-amino-4-deoxy-L-arabinose transferase-like glycosyltransferase
MNGGERSGRRWAWLALVAVLLFALALRVRLLDVPLERDEGEYAYAGRLLLEGVPPFAQAYNMKMPGIYAVYAAMMAAFGQSVPGIRLGAALVTAASGLFLFLALRRRFDLKTSWLCSAGFALLSLGPAVQGVMANAEPFVLPFALAGLWALLAGLDRDRAALVGLSGLLFGLSGLVKQHGYFLALFGGVYLLGVLAGWSGRSWRHRVFLVFLFGAGVFLPFVLTAGYFYRAGVFGRFWFWTFTYASRYVSMTPLSIGLENFEHQAGRMFHDFSLLLALAGVGLLAPFWDRGSRAAARFTHPLALFSFLATCPGLYFRPHYFFLLLPALSLLAAIAVPALARLWAANRIPPRALTAVSLFFLAAVAFPLARNGAFFFTMSPEEACHQLYGDNPFPEAVTVSAYIRERSTPRDRIAVLGSEPEVYFYADRRAATGYLYVYAMTEPHAFALSMQKEMRAQIEAARPRLLVLFGNPDFWPLPRMAFLVDWMAEYIPRHYRLVGAVDFRWPGPSVFVWGERASGLEPVSAFWIKVFERLAPAEAEPALESRPAPHL